MITKITKFMTIKITIFMTIKITKFMTIKITIFMIIKIIKFKTIKIINMKLKLIIQIKINQSSNILKEQVKKYKLKKHPLILVNKHKIPYSNKVTQKLINQNLRNFQ